MSFLNYVSPCPEYLLLLLLLNATLLCCHVMLHNQVKIMKDWDPTGRQGPKEPLPDVVKVHEPKEEEYTADKLFAGKEDI
jgi:hypothetical protein